jgi:hypothetical protein
VLPRVASSEQAVASPRRLLVLASDQGSHPQPWQVGELEGGLGAGTNRHPRAVDAADCCADGPRVHWEEDPGLEPVFNPMLGRIWILAEGGLTSMMVLHDYVSKRIMPL